MTGLTYRTKQNKLYKWRKANGIEAFTDAAPVQAHILELKAIGLTDSMIAHAAGCDPQNIWWIVNGVTQKMSPDIARRIQNVTHLPHPNQYYVLTVGLGRRVRALNAIGWTTQTIAERIGMSGKDRLNGVIAQPVTTYTRWAAIRDLYNELSGTPGPSLKSIQVARRMKHVPPLAWDGIDINDPRAQPDWAAAGIKRADIPVCHNNHRYTKENTRFNSSGQRECITCRRAARARQRAKRSAESA
jgi:hypothetical protein